MALKTDSISLGLREVLLLSCLYAFHPGASPGRWEKLSATSFCVAASAWSVSPSAVPSQVPLILGRQWVICTKGYTWRALLGCNAAADLQCLFFLPYFNLLAKHSKTTSPTGPGLLIASCSIYPNSISASLLTAFATKTSEVFLSHLRPVSPLLLSSPSWPWVQVHY